MKAATILGVVVMAMVCLYMAIKTDSAEGQKTQPAALPQPEQAGDLSQVSVKYPRPAFIKTPAELETGIELGARAGGESGATCCQPVLFTTPRNLI